jgi:hypothetical protein
MMGGLRRWSTGKNASKMPLDVARGKPALQELAGSRRNPNACM